MAIEAEIRSFISKEEYERLLEFFKKNANFVKKDYQETYYFDGEHDLRIQRNNFFSKIWLKKGKIHDNWREEIEVKFERSEFENLKNLLLSLGFNVQIKWLRNRQEFKWGEIKVCLDYTKGYGYIIELEVLCSDNKKEKKLEMLKKKLKELNIELTPKEEFERKFQHYKENWRKILSNT